ncbi:hypothetical protein CCYA_CCYA03G0834 [Cyanidiococcus yangmingshanensis]|nr:hypothetical protein CCYA_CCYA03G0834 [Cyanidiococcus yangmingshanensis]
MRPSLTGWAQASAQVGLSAVKVDLRTEAHERESTAAAVEASSPVQKAVISEHSSAAARGLAMTASDLDQTPASDSTEDALEDLRWKLVALSAEAASFPLFRGQEAWSDEFGMSDPMVQPTEAERAALVEEAVACSIRRGTSLMDWQRVKQIKAELEEHMRRVMRRHQEALLMPLSELQQGMSEIAEQLTCLVGSSSTDDEQGPWQKISSQWKQMEHEWHHLHRLFHVELILRQCLFFVSALRRFEWEHVPKLDSIGERDCAAQEGEMRRTLSEDARILEKAAFAVGDMMQLAELEHLEGMPWIQHHRAQVQMYAKQVEALARLLLDRAVSQRLSGASRALLRALHATKSLSTYLDALMAESLTKADELSALLDPYGSEEPSTSPHQTSETAEHEQSSANSKTDAMPERALRPSMVALEETALMNTLILASKLYPADGLSLPRSVDMDPAIETLVSEYRKRLQRFHSEILEYLEHVAFIEDILADARLGNAFEQHDRCALADQKEAPALAGQDRQRLGQTFFQELATRLCALSEQFTQSAKPEGKQRSLASVSRTELIIAAFYPQLGWALRSIESRLAQHEQVMRRGADMNAEASALHRDVVDEFLNCLAADFTKLAGRAWQRHFESLYRLPHRGPDVNSKLRFATTMHAKLHDEPQLEICFRLAWACRNSLPAFAEVMAEVAKLITTLGEAACAATESIEQSQGSLLGPLLALHHCLWSFRETVRGQTEWSRCVETLLEPVGLSSSPFAVGGTHSWWSSLDQLDRCADQLTRTVLLSVARIVESRLYRVDESKGRGHENPTKPPDWAAVQEASDLLRRLAAFVCSHMHQASQWTRYMHSELLKPLERAFIFFFVLRPVNTDEDLTQLLNSSLPAWRSALENVPALNPSTEKAMQWPMIQQLERLVEHELKHTDTMPDLENDVLPLHAVALFYISRSEGRIRQPHIRLQWPIDTYRTWLERRAHDVRAIWQSIEPSIRLYSQQVYQSTEKCFIPQFRMLQKLRQRLDADASRQTENETDATASA